MVEDDFLFIVSLCRAEQISRKSWRGQVCNIAGRVEKEIAGKEEVGVKSAPRRQDMLIQRLLVVALRCFALQSELEARDNKIQELHRQLEEAHCQLASLSGNTVREECPSITECLNLSSGLLLLLLDGKVNNTLLC